MEAGDAPAIEETPIDAQSIPETATKVRKQLPQRYIDAFWEKVCNPHLLVHVQSL